MFLGSVVLFVLLGVGVQNRYAKLKSAMASDAILHKEISEIIQLTSKAKEAVLMYRISDSKEHLVELVDATVRRARAIDLVKARSYRSSDHVRFTAGFAEGQARFQILQNRAITAIDEGRRNEANRLFGEWSRLEQIHSAKYWDFIRFIDRDMQRNQARMESLVSWISRSMLGFLAAGALLTWYLTGYFQRTLIGPLERLKQGFAAVGAGQLETSVAVPRTGDELEIMSVEFNKMTETLRQSRQDLRNFVSVAAHDLRSPIATIRGFAGVLKEELADAAMPESIDAVNRIDAIARRSLEMMDSLLTLEKADSAPIEMRPVEIRDVISESLENLHNDIKEAGAQINVAGAGRVHGDRDHLRGLFQNLVSNSLKYRKPGVVPEIKIEAGHDRGGAMLRIRVSDNGQGFDNKVGQKIFAPFTRLDNTSDTEGFGVGLSTCRRIVERHSGRISASGEVGRGAEFTVDLPLART